MSLRNTEYKNIADKDQEREDKEITQLISSLLMNDQANRALSILNKHEIIQPNNSSILFLKGLCLKHVERYQEAETAFLSSLESFPSPPVTVLIELANCQYELGKRVEACNTLALADLLGQKPSSTLYLKQIGVLYYKLQMYSECINFLEHYVDTGTEDNLAYEVLASALEIKNRPLDAIKVYQKALKNGARSAQACRNIAVILNKLDKRRLALKYLEKAAKLDLTYDDPCNKFMCAASILDFEKRNKYLVEALNYTLRTTAYSEPFPLFFGTDDPDHLLRATKAHSDKFDLPASPLGKNSIDAGRLKIGYMSADFKNHATTYLIEEFIRYHDRDRFTVYGFDFSPKDVGAEHHKIRDAFDELIDLSELSDEAAATTIARMSVDILIDLKGYTRSSRPGILSYRPAPIQINYLGYPGTMGNSSIDYIIGDTVVSPIRDAEHFSEKIIELGCCYQPNMPSRIPSKRKSKIEYGLPQDAFVFCCFNHHWKWTQEILDAWREILYNCPKSVLWVLKPIHEADIQAALTDARISPERVITAPLMSINDHLARIGHADLFLDTFPCGGHTTASDSIRSGVPVLCIRGKSFHSRVSASIMTHASCPEFVCSDLDDYISQAIFLYSQPKLLAVARKKLLAFESHGHPFNVEFTRRQVEESFVLIAKNHPKIDHLKLSP